MSTTADDAPADDAAAREHPRTVARSSNTFLGDAWVNAKRWTRKALRNPFVVMSRAYAKGRRRPP